MKAVQISGYGGIEVLEIADVPNPEPAENQVLVQIHAASINPIDWKIRVGYLKERMPLNFPVTLGGDFSGLIVKVGDNVSDLKIGDEVYGQASFLNGGSGSFAEFATANINKLSIKPSVDHVRTAALPLVGASALQALEYHIKLADGQKILIHGGAGGIGHIAIQLAKEIGAYVATTVSTEDKEFVKTLGADLAIDYKNEKFEEIAKDYDAVFDNVGGEVTNRSFQILKKGGIIVSMVGAPSSELAEKYGVTAIGQSTNSNNNHFKRLSKLVDAGKIKINVDKTFNLDQVKDAFQYMERIHPQGKIVLKIK